MPGGLPPVGEHCYHRSAAEPPHLCPLRHYIVLHQLRTKPYAAFKTKYGGRDARVPLGSTLASREHNSNSL